MAKNEVTGRTQEFFEDLVEEYDPSENDGKPFEEAYCMAPIPHQPEGYDGPPRFCYNPWTHEQSEGVYLCKHHGGLLNARPSEEDRHDAGTAAITHGMNATVNNLIKDFDEKDQALYDWIIEKYPEAYDLNLDEDPSTKYDLHRLAAEIVRAERGRGFLAEEGEVHEKKVRSDEGHIVTDENGDVVTEKSEHYLAGMMHRQDKKISQLEKQLGVSRRERLKNDQTADAVDAVKDFAEIGKTILARDEKEYDPDDQPWEDDE